MKPLKFVIGAAIAGFLATVIVIAALAPAHSHEWYDRQCCSGQDCEPLPDGAVTQVPGGYHVKYKAKLGLDVDVIVPHNKAKPSQDGRYHGCATIDRFMCLYVPMAV